jgi:argininosuccinate lyase
VTAVPTGPRPAAGPPPELPSAEPPAGPPSAGPPSGPPSAELIAAGFALENADAPVLHHGINLADLAHLLDLGSAGVIPPPAARRMLVLVLDAMAVPASEFPYDPANGEPYNSREKYFAERAGDVAGWLHAGRPRREAIRIAFRLRLRADLARLIEAAAALAAEIARQARAHASTLMADQTYLQHAQPSTFGHYVLSFAYPVLRAGRRLSEALEWTDASPGGAGCVHGTRLRSDRGHVAALLGFRSIAEHTRDAMWQTDGLFDMVSAAAGLVVTQSELAEDLEIWASQEFDYVTLADGYSRASVLMPQKRNPYALSIIRGAAGTLDRLTLRAAGGGQDPSARSDNLIFAYGEVPRGPRPRAADHRSRARGRGAHAHGQLRSHGGRAGIRLLAGHRPGRVRDAGVRGGLPDRVPGGRPRGARGERAPAARHRHRRQPPGRRGGRTDRAAAGIGRL